MKKSDIVPNSSSKKPPASREPVGPGAVRRSVWLVLACILLIGGGLRLINLARGSFMIDEVNVVRFAKDAEGYGGIVKTEYDRFSWMHRMPLPIMLIRAGIDLTGDTAPSPGEFSTRLPSALLGIASILLLFLAARRMAGDPGGLTAAALLALSVFNVYFSREAYDYALVMMAAAGTLYAFARIHADTQNGGRLSLKTILIYFLLSTLLMHSHLSGVIYLVCLLLITGLILLRERQVQHARWGGLVRTLLILAAPCLTLIPLGLALLAHPFAATEQGTAQRFSWDIPVAILGRMGWGEAWWAMLPFALCVGGGLLVLWKKDRRLWWLLAGGTLLYAAIQTVALRMARFEVRYFAPLFPMLLCAAALGLVGAIAWLRQRWGRRLAIDAAVAVAVALVGWLTPSLVAVNLMKLRGGSGYYKYCAAWVMEHLPTNGTYCFRSVYPLRGVPNAYATPERWGTYLVPTDSPAENRTLKIASRFASFFRRFPLAVFFDELPDFIKEMPTLPLNDWLLRTEWLDDAGFNLLDRLHTAPWGAVQPGSSRLRICYNLKADLPELARRHGATWYHYQGPEWTIFKDERSLLDGMIVQETGTLVIGSLAAHPQQMHFIFSLAAVGGDLKVAILPPAGQGNARIIELPAGQITSLEGPTFEAKPGENQFTFKVLNPDPGRRLLFIDITDANRLPAGAGSAPAATAPH